MRVQKWQLPLLTLSCTLSFMVWVILSGLMPFIKEEIPLTASQTALVTAIPVILGSILRIVVGYWTNRFGARTILMISFLVLLVPVFYVSQAHSYTDLVIGGLFLGISGGIFSVGVTSLPKYYPKEKHGLINGIYGMGNIGTAITTFSAPILANHFGWSTTVQLYMGLLIAFAALVFFFGDRGESKITSSLTDQVKGVYRNEKLWLVSLFYFITFGSFVAFTVYLPNFLVSYFHIAKVDAGLRTAGFIALATVFRPIGGWLGDKVNPYKILIFVFAGFTLSAVLLAFSPAIGLYTLGCLSIAICAGIGNGTIFKLVPLYFSKQAGIANGVVSAMGGLGGFFPPLILTFLFDLTGHYSIGFMALSEVALASLILVIWLYYHERLELSGRIVEHTIEGVMVTNPKGIIEFVNPAFTEVTGYTPAEVIGKTPRILKSDKQGKEFYQTMWKALNEEGAWQGEVWNQRKNGDVYVEWLTISAIRNEAGEVKQYAAMFSELSTQQNSKSERKNSFKPAMNMQG
ncbi:MAG TPA: MFS transporter [Bacillota bacterium]|nr:MFS transporter [Bacillota bacterium]